jgi:hypothetical protein
MLTLSPPRSMAGHVDGAYSFSSSDSTIFLHNLHGFPCSESEACDQRAETPDLSCKDVSATGSVLPRWIPERGLAV